MALSMAVLLMLIAPAMGVGRSDGRQHGSAVGDEVPAAGCRQSIGVAEDSLLDDETQAAMAPAKSSHGRGMLQRSAEAQNDYLSQDHNQSLGQNGRWGLIKGFWTDHLRPFITGGAVEVMGSIKVALRTAGGPNKGKYCADEGNGDDGKIVCNREKIGAWETFKLVKLRAFRLDDPTRKEHWGLMGGRYSNYPFWCADEGGQVVCDREYPKDWENFHIVLEQFEESGGLNKYSIRGGQYHKHCSSKSETMTCLEAGMGEKGAETWEIVELEPRIMR